MTLPSRSEIIRRIKFLSHNTDIFIPNQGVAPGIFVPNIIVHLNSAFIRFLNTTDNIVTIKNNNIKTENLIDYEIITQNLSNNKQRKCELMNTLKKNFPKQFHTTLVKLYTEYSDDFALDTEPITTNNFYGQRLRIKQKQPECI